MTLVTESHIIQFGKFKGKTLTTEFLNNNLLYFQWCHKQPFIVAHEDIKKILDDKFKSDEYIISFGRYKNKPISILKTDKKYCLYLLSNDYVKNNMPEFYKKVYELEI